MSNGDDKAANRAQIDYWNETAGVTWARYQAQLDRQIEPLGNEALRALAAEPGERILDIGCGCGQTTLALAQQVTSLGSINGVDISAPMLAVAKARTLPDGAATPQFLELDAQSAALGDAIYDAIFSRFGVMFFSDPTAAFTNLRRALKPTGRLAFVCWQPYQQNLWMRLPMEAAQPFLPPPQPSDPTAPGPFAFSDADRIRSILGDAGFADVTITPFKASIGGATVEQTLDLTFRVGPLGAALRSQPELSATVAGAVKTVLVDFETPDGVLMPAAVWIVQGRAGLARS